MPTNELNDIRRQVAESMVPDNVREQQAKLFVHENEMTKAYAAERMKGYGNLQYERAIQLAGALEAMARSKESEAVIFRAGAMAIRKLHGVETTRAQQDPQASPHDGGSGAQSEVRREGWDTGIGSQRVQQGGSTRPARAIVSIR